MKKFLSIAVITGLIFSLSAFSASKKKKKKGYNTSHSKTLDKKETIKKKKVKKSKPKKDFDLEE